MKKLPNFALGNQKKRKTDARDIENVWNKILLLFA